MRRCIICFVRISFGFLYALRISFVGVMLVLILILIFGEKDSFSCSLAKAIWEASIELCVSFFFMFARSFGFLNFGSA